MHPRHFLVATTCTALLAAAVSCAAGSQHRVPAPCRARIAAGCMSTPPPQRPRRRLSLEIRLLLALLAELAGWALDEWRALWERRPR